MFVIKWITVLLLISTHRLEAQKGVCQDSIEQPQAALHQSVNKAYEVDVTFILDRSQSVHNIFDQSKSLIGDLLHRYYIVHPDFARVTILTFANRVTTIVDPSYQTVSACIQDYIVGRLSRMNASSPLENESAISKALDKAGRLLRANHRDGVRQVIWLISDGQVNSQAQNPDHISGKCS